MATIPFSTDTDRGEARFFFTMACLMAAIILGGFSFNIVTGRSSFALPWVVHFHAWVMMAWVGLYLALGWLVLVAIKPMIDGLSWVALLLLAIGGVVYSTGTIFYLMRRLKFRRAIWHGHVIGGAGLHYAAVLVGVVLASAH